MDTIETLFGECDTELAKAEMSPLGYEKQDIGTMIEHMVILVGYVYAAHPQCYCELDKPLFEAFKNGATETLSNIVLDDITTENTFGMQEYVEVPGKLGSLYTTEVKANLTMADFLGLEEVTPENGIPALKNVETLGWFTNLLL